MPDHTEAVKAWGRIRNGKLQACASRLKGDMFYHGDDKPVPVHIVPQEDFQRTSRAIELLKEIYRANCDGRIHVLDAAYHLITEAATILEDPTPRPPHPPCPNMEDAWTDKEERDDEISRT